MKRINGSRSDGLTPYVANFSRKLPPLEVRFCLDSPSIVGYAVEEANKRARRSRPFIFRPLSSSNPVLLEPGEHALPAVVGGFLAVARPVIGVERVRHAVVDVDHRLAVLAEGDERRAHALDRVQGDAGVGAAVQAQHRRVQLVGNVDRRERLRRRVRIQAAVPGHPRLDALAVRRIHPDGAAAAAETGDAELPGVRLGLLIDPGDQGVQVREHLLVGERVCLADHFLLVGDLREVTDAEEGIERDGVVARLRHATRHVLDVLVHAEHFGDDDHRGVLARLLRRGEINGQVDA